VEVCPVSNVILGYVGDLRNHTAVQLIQNGVPISISSDDPGLFGYDGVTLDYVYATLAWQLTIRDLKMLCLNNIKYSSFSQEIK